ncbi:MAG: RteC domain-containing protein [Chryseobacterium sp.]|uniref:RteC domain-containing protein n=1 Tax=Chryseobacterium sp. G0201 TaxID=2487065 RepID=UPI000F516614|nr:RteC domain-containing protein [Chryseobacterium sp. G0201]AZA54488.1 tetracycline regulation of excision, RteC [Chryseobacterium sp. G0201]MDN5477723.1 RteC domain-containing protein [Chryseobacterium sp.]
MKAFYKTIQERIKDAEQQVSLDSENAIEESRRMAILLKELLNELRTRVLTVGFQDESEEIDFFRKIKPEVQGKLLYYNKVFRIETGRPVNFGTMYQTYFLTQLHRLEENFKEHISNSEFYRYYRSDSRERDNSYFTRGKMDFNTGLQSHFFESDPLFSTYYDYKVSRIIETDLLYQYLLMRTSNDLENTRVLLSDFGNESVNWTDSKNALIELIYALHATECIGNGNIGIRKVALAFQSLFNIQLGDVHHAFHRMKYRSGSRSIFLERMKSSLEQYMDKEFM